MLPALLLLLLTSTASLAQSAFSAGAANKPAPAVLHLEDIRSQNFSVTALDGSQLNLTQVLGQNHAVVIEFWATWCAPCRKLTPVYIELAHKYREQGLVVVGLTVEKPVEDADKVKNYVRQHGVDYLIAFSPPEIYRFFNRGKADITVPRAFVFAPDGTLVKEIDGVSLFGTPGKIRKAVERAVAGNQK